ncbi:MAG: hypothetical protein B6241_03570 [Spirochaetaceae bacterium 4572_59]|nr:MAG: hypothetical protein B6241_03570 [Spirochaetaceae bacterium 4572_59]
MYSYEVWSGKGYQHRKGLWNTTKESTGSSMFRIDNFSQTRSVSGIRIEPWGDNEGDLSYPGKIRVSIPDSTTWITIHEGSGNGIEPYSAIWKAVDIDVIRVDILQTVEKKWNAMSASITADFVFYKSTLTVEWIFEGE